MTRIAVATTSQLAADAALEVAAAGGNAVDCALAASLLTMNTEPGVCALAGGAYVTVWKPGDEPITVDGNVAVPGAGLHAEQLGRGTESVTLDYGGGITTLVGAGSVGVPGSVAAIERAWQRYGTASWAAIFAPSIRAAREGFPLSAACRYYLGYSGDVIYGRAEDGHAALHEGERLLDAGALVVVPHLADSLSMIAEDGARVFYEGDLARAMLEHCQANDGALSRADLADYRAVDRPCLRTRLGEWSIVTNPPPAVGGAVLSAMLESFAAEPFASWDVDTVGRLIAVQRACLGFRKQRLDLAVDVGAEARALLDEAANGRLLSRWTSASTVHTSAVDENGIGCSITASSGYGSGEMPPGTGLWLNNCLGELELNRRGLDAGPIGARLPSNMAPSVACREGRVLAVGSPGADRITTAMHQFLVNALQADMHLEEAVAIPRLHIDTSGDEVSLAVEEGIALPDDLGLALRRFDGINMYFGGVGAVAYDRETGFEIAADPRREGATCLYDGRSAR